MPGYVQKALERLGHVPPTRQQNAPHKWVPIMYGKEIRNAPLEDKAPILTPIGIKHIQQVFTLH